MVCNIFPKIELSSGAKRSFPIALVAFALISPKTRPMVGFVPAQSKTQLENFFFEEPLSELG